MQQIDWNGLIEQGEKAGTYAGFEPLPDGEYLATITKAEAKMSQTGKPMIVINARVETGDQKGRIIFNNFTLTADNPKASGIFMRHMAAFGLDKNYFASNPNISFEHTAQLMLNKTVWFRLGHKEYQGRVNNQVQNVRPSLPADLTAATAGPTPTGLAPTAPSVPIPVVPPAQAPVPVAAPVEPQIPIPAPAAPAPAPAPEAPSTPAPPAPPF